MGQSRGRSRLARESVAQVVERGKVRWQELDGKGPVEREVRKEVLI
jgi:hypothetical protein